MKKLALFLFLICVCACFAQGDSPQATIYNPGIVMTIGNSPIILSDGPFFPPDPYDEDASNPPSPECGGWCWPY